jgi:hypothetical protein
VSKPKSTIAITITKATATTTAKVAKATTLSCNTNKCLFQVIKFPLGKSNNMVYSLLPSTENTGSETTTITSMFSVQHNKKGLFSTITGDAATHYNADRVVSVALLKVCKKTKSTQAIIKSSQEVRSLSINDF